MRISAAQANEESESLVGNFLRGYLKGPEDKTTRYSIGAVSLNGKTENVFVYISGRNWCGSGGCMALLLEPAGASFKVIDKFTLVRLPIRVLPPKHNGWNDIAMRVQGGGAVHGYTAILQFNGHRYPTNPSVAPKLAPESADAGMDIPLKQEGAPLY
jgi:hypothetical protein